MIDPYNDNRPMLTVNMQPASLLTSNNVSRNHRLQPMSMALKKCQSTQNIKQTKFIVKRLTTGEVDLGHMTEKPSIALTDV
jgi:hypothetical protein